MKEESIRGAGVTSPSLESFPELWGWRPDIAEPSPPAKGPAVTLSLSLLPCKG